MADQPAQDKTEEPTDERIRKSREEGQVAHSQEMPHAVMVGALLLSLAVMGAGLFRWMVMQMQRGLRLGVVGSAESSELATLVPDRLGEGLTVSIPFMLVATVASVAGCLLVSGWAWSPKAVAFKPERVNPAKGFQNLVSKKSLVNLLVSVAKMILIVALVWTYIRDKIDELLALRWYSPEGIAGGAAGLVMGVTVRVLIGLVVVAALDWAFQRWNHRKELRMTRQEVKEERKQHEVSPEIRSRIRGLQITMARKRMLKDVSAADVVLANPTHVAVAVRYDAARMNAPTVVAKGPDLLCEKMKEIARAHNVPIVYRPELARALYATVEVGAPVPESLFVAVAEVLAMIYRLRRGRNALAAGT